MKKHMKKAISALLAVMLLAGMMPLGSLAEEVLEIVEIFQDFTGEASVEELEIVQEEAEAPLQDIIPDAPEAEPVPEEEEELLQGFDTLLLALAREASACGHMNLYVEEAIEKEAYTSLGKEKHLHAYLLASRSLICGDCETIIQTVPVGKTIVETGAHDWYNKGSKLYCHDCSVVRTVKYPCSHKKLSMTENGELACPKCGKKVVLNKEQSGCEHSRFTVWEPNGEYVSHYQKISEEMHLKVSLTPVYEGDSRFALCDDCGAWLETLNGAVVSAGITDTVYTDAHVKGVQEAHSLENGICTLCEQSRLSNTLTLSGADKITAGKTAKYKVVNAEGKSLSVSKLIWSSSDKRIASVSKGVVTAKKAGTVTISAADASGNFGTWEIRILPKAGKVSILYNGADAGKTLGVDMGEITSLQLSAVTEPEDAADAVSWKSSSTKVAKVDANGLVTIKGKGKATITATAKDGSKKYDSVTLNVAVLVKGMEITSGAAELTSGKTMKLKVSVSPAKASKSVSWKSSNTSAATISKDGVVTAKKVSVRTPVTITATAKDGSGVTAVREIFICPKQTKVTITDISGAALKTAELNLRENNGTLQLQAGVDPVGAMQTVTWKSSNTKIAKVSADGLVTGLKVGSVTITAKTPNGKTASCTIKVVDEEPPARPELVYTVNDGGLTITGYWGEKTDVVIPSMIDGMTVTAIGSAAFKDNAAITSISIPASVVSIGEDAFNNCDGLTTIELPRNLTKISARSFYGCDGLKSVYLSNNVTEIGAAAFAYCPKLKTMEPR